MKNNFGKHTKRPHRAWFLFRFSSDGWQKHGVKSDGSYSCFMDRLECQTYWANIHIDAINHPAIEYAKRYGQTPKLVPHRVYPPPDDSHAKETRRIFVRAYNRQSFKLVRLESVGFNTMHAFLANSI